ncbi:undecaprenyldiphospho-muramoylpentapeptide beta-N-acetylglucosaminyltransferase [Paenibacillus daejeonensis]|uniref:undecaprenyldiphospho-muramoylpentapeptide beta-N-acetylglucosaminyltransferase n=1 Tax=Paenibacillus daejeonensis TaxID=135193 RepID=UPI00036081DA|nr:undecaprenyldiphospho-muramoylpentapeptide beta-N-acetylglucosaminyltransferase [Paenibacillus daejeonensis]
MRIVLTGGGTGGHIYPALAIGRQVQQSDQGSALLYIGTERGLESRIVPEAGLPFEAIDITGFKRKLSLDNVKTVLRFLRGVRRSKQLLRSFKPDAVVGTGGYVCGPVVYAAAALGIPTLIHEQNVDPGLTNKFLSRYASVVAVSFEASKPRFGDQAKVVYTGNPCATAVLQAERGRGLASLGLRPGKKLVLCVGGSRGAKVFNESIIDMADQLASLPEVELVFATGEIYYEQTMQRLEARQGGMPSNLHVRPYIHNMAEVLADTSLVISRSGASSLAEITALGLPSILVPSPNVTANHQEANARSLVDAGAAVMILERDLSGSALLESIRTITSDASRLSEMGKASLGLGMPEAAIRIAAELQRLSARP